MQALHLSLYLHCDNQTATDTTYFMQPKDGCESEVCRRAGDWSGAVSFGLAVAVGLTPQMLPMIVVANLSRSVRTMRAKKTAIRRMDAIQNLGAMCVHLLAHASFGSLKRGLLCASFLTQMQVSRSVLLCQIQARTSPRLRKAAEQEHASSDTVETVSFAIKFNLCSCELMWSRQSGVLEQSVQACLPASTLRHPALTWCFNLTPKQYQSEKYKTAGRSWSEASMRAH